MGGDMLLSGYGILVAFIILSTAFASAALILSWIVQPKAPNKWKKTTYECGMKTYGDSRIQFCVKYYMYALLFIIFDIEAVFLFPWAVVFDKLGLYAFIEAVIFVLILVLGLAYAWRKGALKWQ